MKRDKNENLKKFSSGYQPKKNGRPKKYVNKIKEETGYTLIEIQDCIKQMLKFPIIELKKIGESSTAPALEVLVARGIHGDLRKSELRNLEALLSRSYGKPKEISDVKLEINPEKEYTDEELKEELKKRNLPVLDIEE